MGFVEVIVHIDVGAQARATVPVNPLGVVSMTLKGVGVPLMTTKDFVDGVKLKPPVEVPPPPPPPLVNNAVPVPVSATYCGELVPLSVIVNVPVCGPTAWGLKVTVIVQLVFAARFDPQVYVALKSPGVVCWVIWMLVMVSGVVPVL